MEDPARERYLAAWEQERRLDDEAWLASVRRHYPVVEEFQRKRTLWADEPPQDQFGVDPAWQYLYQDWEGLD